MHNTDTDSFPHSRLLNLPGELIKLIIEIIHNDGRERASVVFSIGRTCKALREVTLPLMFYHRHIQLHSGHLDASNHKYLQLILNPSSRIADHVVEVHINDSQDAGLRHTGATGRLAGSTSDCTRADAISLLRNGLKAMKNLRTVRFNPYGVFSAPFIEDLTQRSIHLILDQSFREFPGYFEPTFFTTSIKSQSTWSLAVNDGKIRGNWVEALPNMNVRALELMLPSGVVDPNQLQILDALKQNSQLEELQVSEKCLDLQEQGAFISHATRICDLLISLPSLRRLSVEGSMLTARLLETVAHLSTVEDLRIYSSYRAAFHPGCTDIDTCVISTTEMPWLQLPKLKKLDIRFICRHFTIQQLVPKRLKALRLEFYGAKDRLSQDELRWLGEESPNLDTLQFDLGNLNDIYLPAPALNICWGNHASEASQLFRTLLGFRNLQTLRLFPSYWQDGSMTVSPIQNSFQLAFIFRTIQRSSPSFRKLYVCISYGEYPFDLVPRMAEYNRPWKYVMADASNGDLCLQSGFGAKAEIHEMLYTANNGIVTRGTKAVQPRTFIDDLTGWILPHYDLAS